MELAGLAFAQNLQILEEAGAFDPALLTQEAAGRRAMTRLIDVAVDSVQVWNTGLAPLLDHVGAGQVDSAALLFLGEMERPDRTYAIVYGIAQDLEASTHVLFGSVYELEGETLRVGRPQVIAASTEASEATLLEAMQRGFEALCPGDWPEE
jgi:hypothetical protein